MVPHLTELPIDCAISLAGRKLDRGFAIEMAQLEAELIRDGVNRDSIDGLLEYRRGQFVIWRAQELTELRDWLLDYNRKLH
jgi:hypothetical protein